MKKLMIAAAAAAMIGGAFADIAYDFKATLKTTTAKNGKSVATKVNLGQDANGVWWYKAAATDTVYRAWVKYDKNGVGKLSIPKGTSEEEKKAFADAFGPVFNVPETYRGKERWCATISYKLSGCYRVAGKETVKLLYTTDDCCTGFSELDGEYDDISTTLLYRFGALNLEKATKVEFVGELGTWGDIGGFALAGQGTWSDKLYKDEYYDEYVAGVKSISGNIVGMLDNSECEVCCGENGFATVFHCDGTEYSVDMQNTADAEGSAAYGSFTLKFNKKATLAL